MHHVKAIKAIKANQSALYHPNTAAASPLPKFVPSSCAPVFEELAHLQGKRINVRAVTTIVYEPYGGSAWGARLKQAVAYGVAAALRPSHGAQGAQR